jgi:membrane-associated protease RseP (regulator of RpoE activity)
MVDGELLTAIIFYAILFLCIYKYRSKFTHAIEGDGKGKESLLSKLLFIYKTERGIGLMRILARFEWFWKIFSTIAIPVSVYFMLKIGTLLWGNMLGIIGGTAGAGVAIAIPGIKIPGSPIFIPFWYGMISIAVLAVVHEFGHGIVATMEGVRIKSTGFGFLAIIPLAFVELDEEQMREMPPLSRLRILASGAFANVSLYFLLMLFLILVFSPFVSSLVVINGINVTSVVSGQPAAVAGINDSTVITGVNGNQTLGIIDFINAMSFVKPGDTVQINTTEKVFNVNTIPDPKNSSKPYIGVFLEQASKPTEDAKNSYGIFLPVIQWFYGLFWWIANLNLLIGIMNFLPIWGLDGSRIAYDLTGYVVKNQKVFNMLMNLLFAFFLALLLFNIVGPIIF